MRVIIVLPGPPKGKGRPRFSRKLGIAYTPTETRNYEGMLRDCAVNAMDGRPPIKGPVCLTVVSYFPIAPSWSKKKQTKAANGLIFPTVRPDVDNIVKMTDALNGIVWDDDRQVISCEVFKRFSRSPRLHIDVTSYENQVLREEEANADA
jgi:Holliday junction resolvase RusA-like endonuclease